MKKKILVVLLTVAMLFGVGYLFIGNPVIAYHNYELKKAILAVNSEEMTLNDLVPFEWEVVYTFSPYTSSEEIEQVIGFKSNNIQETVSENMVQLLFVNNGSVTASICGYEDQLGYRVNFSDFVTYDEKAVFSVSQDHEENTIVLTKI